MDITRKYLQQLNESAKIQQSHSMIVENSERTVEDNRTTVIFSIDFSSPEALSELERYKQEGIKEFKEFLAKSEPNKYLCYTIRKSNSQYKNDYLYYVDILYDFGFYEDTYALQATGIWDHSSHRLFKRVSAKVETIEKNIETCFDKVVNDAKDYLY